MKFNFRNIINLFRGSPKVIREPLEIEINEEEVGLEELDYYEKNCIMTFYQIYDENMDTYFIRYRNGIWRIYAKEDGTNRLVESGTTIFSAFGATITAINDRYKEEEFFKTLTKPKLKEDIDEFIERLKEKNKVKQFSL